VCPTKYVFYCHNVFISFGFACGSKDQNGACNPSVGVTLTLSVAVRHWPKHSPWNCHQAFCPSSPMCLTNDLTRRQYSMYNALLNRIVPINCLSVYKWITRILLLHTVHMLFVCLIPSYTVSNDTNLVCHDFNTYWLILIIFGRSVIEKVSSETVIYSPSYLTNDSALHYLAKHENTKIISFHLNAVSLFETQCIQLLTMSAFDVFTPFCLCSLTSVVHYKVFSVILLYSGRLCYTDILHFVCIYF